MPEAFAAGGANVRLVIETGRGVGGRVKPGHDGKAQDAATTESFNS
jgi:hypothetical protein